MKPIGMMQALRLCGAYEKAPPEKRSAIREERLRALVDYARKNSPYYGKLYQDVPENWSLSQLPATDKRTAAHFPGHRHDGG